LGAELDLLSIDKVPTFVKLVLDHVQAVFAEVAEVVAGPLLRRLRSIVRNHLVSVAQQH